MIFPFWGQISFVGGLISYRILREQRPVTSADLIDLEGNINCFMLKGCLLSLGECSLLCLQYASLDPDNWWSTISCWNKGKFPGKPFSKFVVLWHEYQRTHLPPDIVIISLENLQVTSRLTSCFKTMQTSWIFLQNCRHWLTAKDLTSFNWDTIHFKCLHSDLPFPILFSILGPNLQQGSSWKPPHKSHTPFNGK